MRDLGGEVDRVPANAVRPALAGGTHRAGRGRFAALVGSTVVCAVGLWCPGPVGIASALAAACPNEASRQGPSLVLPECRVYEQVTPVDKGDATDIFGSLPKGEKDIAVDEGNRAYVAEDGDAILVHADGSFVRQTTADASSYVFARNAKEWQMNVLAQSIAAPQEVGEEGPELYDPSDLSRVGFSELSGADVDLLGGQEAALDRSYLVGPVGGPYAPLYKLIGRSILDSENWVEPIGGSKELGVVVMESENHSLAPAAEGQDAGTEALYETASGECGATSSCRLLDVKPEGGAMPCGATLGQGELGEGGAYSAVSSDGSRVFFTAPEPEKKSGPGCWNPGAKPYQENPPELYMREGGERTAEISKPEEGVSITAENPLLPAVFVGASSDGSKVFFVTRTELTKNAVGQNPELYEYETESGALTLISGDALGAVEGDVDSVTAISSDGSSVYFSAFGKLASGASNYSPGGEDSSLVNLYRYDTVTGSTTYITTLNKYDYPSRFGQVYSWYTKELGGGGAENEGLDHEKEWYATADGQFLVFGTSLPLTGFDNAPAPGAECPNNYIGEFPRLECFELYRYDAATGQIVCVSCAGGAPVDGAYFARAVFDSPASGTPRPISENGEDVFFESANALVPQAVLGRDHVYEWHDGAISLISSPDDPGNAIFLGSSASGSDVFFVTHAQLSAQDTDQAADIYDARVDGGFPEVTPPECTGTGCQGVPAASPIFATPASVTFEGVGNFTVSEPPGKTAPKSKAKPKQCKAGSVKKHATCIRRKTGKAKRSARGRK
jgi:hypothetical protein